MPYVGFHDHFPEIARRETRTVTLLASSPFKLPPGEYALLEMYCDEPGCDCRRVFFYVVSSRSESPEAVVAYGWESAEFYDRWAHDSDPEVVERILIEEAVSGAREISGLLADPAPFVRFIPGFGNSSLDFTLICQASLFSSFIAPWI